MVGNEGATLADRPRRPGGRLRRYAREEALDAFSRARVPARWKERVDAQRASGACARRTTTRIRPRLWAAEGRMTPSRTRGSVSSPTVRRTGWSVAAAGRAGTSAAISATGTMARRTCATKYPTPLRVAARGTP